MVTPATITAERIHALCGSCAQCVANALTNLAGGHSAGAVACVEYHLRGHRPPTPAEALTDEQIRAFRTRCQEFVMESRLALGELTLSPDSERAAERAQIARARCAEIINTRPQR